MFLQSSNNSNSNQSLFNAVGLIAAGVGVYGYVESNHSLTVAAAAVCAGSFFAVSRILSGSIFRTDQNDRFRKVWSDIDEVHARLAKESEDANNRVFETEDRLARQISELVPQSEFRDYMRNTSDRFDETHRNIEEQVSNICRMHDQDSDALHRRIDQITDLTNECREACESKRSK